MEMSPPPISGPENWADRFAVSLQAECDLIHEFLASQQAQFEQAEASLEQHIQRLEEAAEEQAAEASPQHDCPIVDDGYQRRYEMALDDLDDLKAENAKLQQQIGTIESTATDLPRQQGGVLDWEAEKQRTLAALESDLDADPEAEPPSIEDVCPATEKDLDTQDMEQRLEEPCSDASDETAADEQVIEDDPVVLEEREQLRQLQERLQEKLRQAEIDISLERAKLARQNAELKERIHGVGIGPTTTTDATGKDSKAGRPARGRWLARLGLTEADRDPGRPR